MIKIYSSEMCPDCRDFKKNLDRYKITYEIIDINSSLRDLKAFLALRDESSVFDQVKKDHSIGIPALVKQDGSVSLDWAGFISENVFEPFYEETGPACSIDGKNC